MTQDKMSNVIAINFNFTPGEMPDATKLNGWRKITSEAISNISEVIGDPHDENIHSGGSGPSQYILSPDKLSQSNISRIIGPSDYLSPVGASWNESVTSSGIVVRLESRKNQWRLGFPLVKKTSSDITPFSTGGHETYFTNLVVGVDLVYFLSLDGQFNPVNLKTDIADVVNSGDWHIDYRKGIITTYDIVNYSAQFIVKNINMLGPGTPWGTANIIPTWNQTSSLCNCTHVSGSSPAVFNISLPNVYEGSRISSSGSLSTMEASWLTKIHGESSKYRLPYSLTANLIANDQIPDGFIYLYNNSQNRIIPLTTFYYYDAYNIRVEVPDITSLIEGELYRIIIVGSSASENINYLLNVARESTASGLQNCFDGNTTFYTNPISHDDLFNLYTGGVSSPSNLYSFSKSSIPLNPHPQYLTRVGYMTDSGNTNNAMRGDIALGGYYNGTDYPIGSSWINRNKTYKILFGGNESYYPYINFSGANSDSASSVLPFGINNTGIVKNNSYTDDYKSGALTLQSYMDYPIYISSYGSDSYDSGASISFDYKSNKEMNYIKVHSCERNTSYDAVNTPANTTSMVSFATKLEVTPSLSNRLSPEQLREWRFRAISKNTASNSGLASPYIDKFVSPGVVGADFFNVYSNAIFFSQDGDGKKTSLHDHIQWFNDSSEDRPVGIYYEPGTYGKFALYTDKQTVPVSTSEVCYFAYDKSQIKPPAGSASIYIKSGTVDSATLYADTGYIKIGKRISTGTTEAVFQADSFNINSNGVFDLDATGSIDLTGNIINIISTNSSDISISAANDLILEGTDYITINAKYINIETSIGDLIVNTGGGLHVECTDHITLNSDENISVTSDKNLLLYGNTLTTVGWTNTSTKTSIIAGKSVSPSNGSVAIGANSTISLASNNAISLSSTSTCSASSATTTISGTTSLTLNGPSSSYISFSGGKIKLSPSTYFEIDWTTIKHGSPPSGTPAGYIYEESGYLKIYNGA